MCFLIDREAKAPKNRKAWKVVYLFSDNGNVRNMHMQYSCYKWCTGEHTIAKSARTSLENHQVAAAGFYVFLRQRDAKSEAKECYMRVIMEVTVDPKDWLYTNKDGNIATYRTVTVPEEQPYMEWY